MHTITADDIAFVRHYARRYAYASSKNYADVVSDGNLGLVEAVHTFDHELGSWGAWRFIRVRAAVVQGIRTREGRKGQRHEVPTWFEDERSSRARSRFITDGDYAHVDTADELRRVWGRLTPREREVFASYADLGPNGQALAASWGVTHARVPQIRRAAQRRLTRQEAA